MVLHPLHALGVHLKLQACFISMCSSLQDLAEHAYIVPATLATGWIQ